MKYVIGQPVTYTGPRVSVVQEGTRWVVKSVPVQLTMIVRTKQDSSGQIGLALPEHRRYITLFAREHELEKK